MLRITDLHAYYGESHILHGIDLRIGRGECATLLGRNGSGRTTTLSILGLVSRRTGSIMLNGNEIIAEPTHRMARHGIGYVPEERAIFASLSTEENLMLPPQVASGGMSGGRDLPDVSQPARAPQQPRQQALRWRAADAGDGAVLRTGAKLLLLDEITEGLAPVIVKKLGEVITELKSRGFTIVLVEQNFRFCHPADRHYVLEHGEIIATISKQELPEKWTGCIRPSVSDRGTRTTKEEKMR